MTYRITESVDETNDQLILRLEGSFTAEGGDRVQQLCDAARSTYSKILIDVNGITFIDDCSASILCNLRNQQGIALAGCHLFTKRCIDQAAKTEHNN